MIAFKNTSSLLSTVRRINICLQHLPSKYVDVDLQKSTITQYMYICTIFTLTLTSSLPANLQIQHSKNQSSTSRNTVSRQMSQECISKHTKEKNSLRKDLDFFLSLRFFSLTKNNIQNTKDTPLYSHHHENHHLPTHLPHCHCLGLHYKQIPSGTNGIPTTHCYRTDR